MRLVLSLVINAVLLMAASDAQAKSDTQEKMPWLDTRPAFIKDYLANTYDDGMHPLYGFSDEPYAIDTIIVSANISAPCRHVDFSNKTPAEANDYPINMRSIVPSGDLFESTDARFKETNALTSKAVEFTKDYLQKYNINIGHNIPMEGTYVILQVIFICHVDINDNNAIYTASYNTWSSWGRAKGIGIQGYPVAHYNVSDPYALNNPDHIAALSTVIRNFIYRETYYLEQNGIDRYGVIRVQP